MNINIEVVVVLAVAVVAVDSCFQSQTIERLVDK
jgi:hypothetical protein